MKDQTIKLPPLPEGWETELLDWVSACQSAYHIDNTPGHRFGNLGSLLGENRRELVEYVGELLENSARAAIEADRQARGEPIGEVLAFPMDGKPQTHSTLAGLENPHPVGMLVYATPQPQQQAGEPVAWLCTPDFEGEQFLATTQGAADTLEKDGWSVQPLYDAPQPQQQTSKHVKDRRIDDVVRGLKASVAVGSDGQWVSVRREARDAAINRLQELNSDCAHMYESYVEAAAGPAPHPQQIPEGYKLVPIEPTDAMLKAAQTAWLNDPARRSTTIYRAMLEAAPEPKEPT